MNVAPGLKSLRTPVLDRLVFNEECMLKCETPAPRMRVGVKGLPSGCTRCCILTNAMNGIEFYINTSWDHLIPAYLFPSVISCCVAPSLHAKRLHSQKCDKNLVLIGTFVSYLVWRGGKVHYDKTLYMGDQEELKCIF